MNAMRICILVIVVLTFNACTSVRRPLPIHVEDANTHSPIQNAKIELSYMGYMVITNLEAPSSSTTVTDDLGNAVVSIAPFFPRPGALRVEAEGYKHTLQYAHGWTDNATIRLQPSEKHETP
jgi:hypothetical protein